MASSPSSSPSWCSISLHAAEAVTGRILWANLHLLFWLSLFPFATGIAAAFRSARLAQGINLLVAALWLVPDRRIESVLAGGKTHAHQKS